MDAPDRSSRSPSPQPPFSSSSTSPQRADSPTGSPGIPRSPAKNLVKFQKVKLNDAPKPDFIPINAANRVKEIKDSINQKTLSSLYETWKTHNIVDIKLKNLLKENKKDPEIPSLRQKLESTNKELKDLNAINDIRPDLLFLDMMQFKVDSDNMKDVEDFCRSILPRMKSENAKALISLIFEKELSLAGDYRTVNRGSSNMSQIFISIFQKGNLSKIIKLDSKLIGTPEEGALKIIKRLEKAIKENKDNDLLRFLYSDLHAKVEAKFPGKGDDLVLSLIVLRFLGPALVTPDDTGIISEMNIQISKIIQSFISKESPNNMNLSQKYIEDGYELLKGILPHLISKP